MVFHLSEVGPIADIKQNVKEVIHSTDRLELLDPHLSYTDHGSSVAEYIFCLPQRRGAYASAFLYCVNYVVMLFPGTSTRNTRADTPSTLSPDVTLSK